MYQRNSNTTRCFLFSCFNRFLCSIIEATETLSKEKLTNMEVEFDLTEYVNGDVLSSVALAAGAAVAGAGGGGTVPGAVR